MGGSADRLKAEIRQNVFFLLTHYTQKKKKKKKNTTDNSFICIHVFIELF